jgi:hypothetical protein
MGIAVAVFMLLGLLSLSPWSLPGTGRLLRRPKVGRGIGIGLLLAGLWNALWHGLRHLDQFWGQAALIAGIFMVLAALLLLGRPTGSAPPTTLNRLTARIRSLQPLVLLGLLACFLLYAVTSVRLNLGYSILG